MTTGTPPTMTVVDVPIDELRPDPANPRRISDAQLEALTRSPPGVRLRPAGAGTPRRQDRDRRSPAPHSPPGASATRRCRSSSST